MKYGAVFLATALFANDEFFEQKIRPVLVEKCYGCHNAKLKSPFGGLKLDSAAATRKGGDSGPAVVPGKPEESRLYTALLYTAGAHLKMPPTGKLADNVIADFKTWIANGAPDPRADIAEPTVVAEVRRPPHWAFQPPKDVRQSIDELFPASKGPAGKREWLRRVTFDVTGLPPTPMEIRDYLADNARDADRNVVDRLLASPHYGERWGRHWLDLVRYSETNGHEFDNDKVDAWQYRDYVIRAFNENIPYNQLIREHLAGDLLAKPRVSRDGAFLESPIASGMMWFGEVLNSATDSVKTRTDVVDNQVDVVSKTFLGLTLACARCHDHKFDPLPTQEYYSMAGIFHSTYVREVVIDSPEREAAITKVRLSLGEVPHKRPQVALRDGDQPFTPPSAWRQSGQTFASHHGAPEFVGSLTSEKFVMPKTWVHILLRGDIAEVNGRNGGPLRVTLVAGDYKSQHAAPKKTTEWQWASMRMVLEIGRTCFFEVVDRDTGKQIEVAQVVFSDQKEPPAFTAPSAARVRRDPVDVPPSTWAMISEDENPHDVKIHVRGSHQNLGSIAPRGFLKAVSASWNEIPARTSGRLELAEWIASPRNPLTARVFVNRVWKHHFGIGLVKSVDNFGKMGDAPSNQNLLDALAQGFVESGWDIKWLQRQMLYSKAYRSGDVPVHRLEAEAIRDSILAVSGGLDRTMYGKSIAPVITEYQDGRGKPATGPLDGNGRRSIYIEVRRNFLTPMFLAFDYPLPISTIGGRGSSTVPSQALLMMNNAFVEQQARLWAERVTREHPADEEKRIIQMYEEAFGRLPTGDERKQTIEFARANSWPDLAHVLFNSAEFIYVQ